MYYYNDSYYNNDYLQHYVVKGMKWGHRKRVVENGAKQNVRNAKAAYKQSKKEFNKSYNKAYNYSAMHPITQWRGKNKIKSDALWDDATNKSQAADKAKAAYKQAKKDRKEKINSTYDKIQKNASVKDKLIYNDATRKQAAKYVVDKNMSVDEAMKKSKTAAKRNTAIFMAAYGGMLAASVYAATK